MFSKVGEREEEGEAIWYFFRDRGTEYSENSWSEAKHNELVVPSGQETRGTYLYNTTQEVAR